MRRSRSQPRQLGAVVRAPEWITVGRVRFPLLRVGDRSGPRAVLLPGLSDGLAPVTAPATRAMLDGAPPGAADLDAMLISYRMPAVGPLTTRALAADMAAVLRHTGHAPALLLCHSMGAMVAQHLTADHPELVSGLVLSATLPAADDAFRTVLARWESLVVARRPLAFAQEAIATSFTGEERRRRIEQARRDPPDPPDDELIDRHVALTAAASTHDARDRLAAIACPTLVLAAEHDQVCPPHHAHAIASAIDGAQLEVFSGLGHGFPEQGADRFASRVGRFVAELTPR